ncbi:hypothetical protein RFI_12080, partial [Reticulomyxa filosa]
SGSKYNTKNKGKHKNGSETSPKVGSPVSNEDFDQKNNDSNNGIDYRPNDIYLSSNNRVSVNVGGNLFETTMNTLASDQGSMLSAMFSGRFHMEKDEKGAFFIDRDPTYFRHILNYLRDGIDYIKYGGLMQQNDAILNELLQEAKFYNIRPLVDYITVLLIAFFPLFSSLNFVCAPFFFFFVLVSDYSLSLSLCIYAYVDRCVWW